MFYVFCVPIPQYSMFIDSAFTFNCISLNKYKFEIHNMRLHDGILAEHTWQLSWHADIDQILQEIGTGASLLCSVYAWLGTQSHFS
jgi:hypothetical protein